MREYPLWIERSQLLLNCHSVVVRAADDDDVKRVLTSALNPLATVQRSYHHVLYRVQTGRVYRRCEIKRTRA